MSKSSPVTMTTKTCYRCGGTGHHSFCTQYGTKCFQCHGSGQVPMSVEEKQKVQACVTCGKFYYRTRANKEQCTACKPLPVKVAPVNQGMPYDQQKPWHMTEEERAAHIASQDWSDWPF